MTDRKITPFVTCKRVRVGVHKNLDTMIKALEKFEVSEWAKYILNRPTFTLSHGEENILLYIATVKQLTGKDEATTAEIFNGIKKSCSLCSSEIGPILREQYLDQQNSECLYIAMEPIEDAVSDLSLLFSVGRDHSGLYLFASYGNPDHIWAGSNRFVFRAN